MLSTNFCHGAQRNQMEKVAMFDCNSQHEYMTCLTVRDDVTTGSIKNTITSSHLESASGVLRIPLAFFLFF